MEEEHAMRVVQRKRRIEGAILDSVLELNCAL